MSEGNRKLKTYATKTKSAKTSRISSKHLGFKIQMITFITTPILTCGLHFWLFQKGKINVIYAIFAVEATKLIKPLHGKDNKMFIFIKLLPNENLFTKPKILIIDNTNNKLLLH